jgi:hypothetical protein
MLNRLDRDCLVLMLLRATFGSGAVVLGLDKYLHRLVNWDQYISRRVSLSFNAPPHSLTLYFGAAEIVAGLTTFVSARWGGRLVALMLSVVAINLLTIPGYFDVALLYAWLAVNAVSLGYLKCGSSTRAVFRTNVKTRSSLPATVNRSGKLTNRPTAITSLGRDPKGLSFWCRHRG